MYRRKMYANRIRNETSSDNTLNKEAHPIKPPENTAQLNHGVHVHVHVHASVDVQVNLKLENM